MMKGISFTRNLVITAFAVSVSSFATAEVINFQDLADNSLGESIWSTLTINGSGYQLAITGTNSQGNAYAYLDHSNGSGRAGLGVCGSPGSPSYVNVDYNGSSTNRCSNSGDDNMTVGESLSFEFDVDMRIENIWLNNNHDDDQSLLNNIVNIGGSAHTFTTGPANGPADFAVNKSFFVPAFTPFEISFYKTEAEGGEQFYVSKMLVNTVPEPSALALLGLGLLGLGIRKKRAH